MKLPEGLMPHLITCKTGVRYFMMNVCYRDGMVSASDGKMLVAAITPKDELDEVSQALIPASFMARSIQKRRKDHPYEGRVKLSEEKAEILDKDNIRMIRDIFQEDVDKFPQVALVIPDIKVPLKLSLNAKMLYQLAKALGNDSVHLTIDASRLGGAIIVENNEKDRVGVLMARTNEGRPKQNLALIRLAEIKNRLLNQPNPEKPKP